MSLRDILEFRAADDAKVAFSTLDLTPSARTIYARPFGESQWGYYSGEMYWDPAYKASHEAVPA